MAERRLLVAALIAAFLGIPAVGFADGDEKPKKKYDLTNSHRYHDDEEEMRAFMKQLAAEIGVKCNYCHDVDDFKKDSPKKKIAKDMMKMTKMLRKAGAKKVTCKTCHMGKPTWLSRAAE
ncbi:MAG: photosynthetic reaction center cytochrome c subunit [Deltaproteobacteria bacterium]|nr:photosynthetic reaction center cytochrome c subunit [Deltaproteobacteria bacterium]